MPKLRRRENRPLPERWRYKHGAYRYRVPPGLEHLWGGKREFTLGKTLSLAHKIFAARVGDANTERILTVGQLLDWYGAHVVPEYENPLTRTAKLAHIKRLRSVFAMVPVAKFKPAYVYQYVTKRGKLTAAHREIETLSHSFTRLIRRGDIDKHPFLGQVRLDGHLALQPRRRYVEDWEVIECLSLNARRKRGSVLAVQAYIRLKLLTGLARGDLLRLRMGENVLDDGIHVTRHKTARTTGKGTIYEYAKVPERREAVLQALAVRPVLSPFLFCNRHGKGYVDETTGESHGWDSMWQRFMDRVLKETNVKARFTEHDLRAKVASDADSLEKARALLQHADARTTQRVYRRRPERV